MPEHRGPPAQVLHVELRTAQLDHSLNVTPLSFRYAATAPIPSEFGKNRVFGRSNPEAAGAPGITDRLRDAPGAYTGFVLGVGGNEYVNLQPGLEVNEVEARLVPHDVANRLFVDVVIRLQLCTELTRVLVAQIRNHVDIVRRPKAAVHRARDGAAHVPGHSQPIQNVDHRRQGDDEVVVLVHPEASW